MTKIPPEEYLKLKADVEKLTKELKLARAHRLAMGSLTLGVAHEIRNPLAVLASQLYIVKKKPRDKEYLKKFSDKSKKYVARIEGIVQKIEDLAKSEKKSTAKEVFINDLVKQALSHEKINENIKVVTSVKDSLKISGIPEDLEKAIFHLIDNACHAMPAGGNLMIKAIEQSGKVEVQIMDDGAGIPHAVKERVFDPFWSTRHEAAGLGLPTAYKIVKEHGGDIEINSAEGKGTTITLRFDSIS
ncbi:sensor histidine kinase [Candidatus Margulisiibacteriota bacterium]